MRSAQRAIGVLGAGIAGPVFALQMLSHPTLRSLYKVTLYDQGPDPYALSDTQLKETAGAAIGMSPNGLYPLYQLGLKDDIERISRDIVGLSAWRTSYGASDDTSRSVKDAAAGPHRFLYRGEYNSWAEDLQTNMRAMERRQLRSLLLDRIARLGGDIAWNKRLQALHTLPTGRVQAVFADQHAALLDLAVGADGGWSLVRQHILRRRNPATAAARWPAAPCAASNVYGISTHEPADSPPPQHPHACSDTHALSLPRGLLSTSPLPGGKLRWDLMVPDPPPPPATAAAAPHEPWHAAIVPSPYPRATTAALLRAHAGVWHPAAGTFGALLGSAQRVVHVPLRRRVWREDEIQTAGAVVIGDAARLMLPSSGSGAAFAVEDATVLADCILNCPPGGGDGFGEAVAEYARRRVARGRRMGRVADWGAKVVMGEGWWWRGVRRVVAAVAGLGGSGNRARKHVGAWPFDAREEVRLRE